MLHVQELTNKTEWNTFLENKDIPFYPLFQSWNWGELEKSRGVAILRLGIYDDTTLVGVCLVTDIKARRGRFLHLRHGPVFKTFNTAYFDAIIDYIKKLAKEKHASFIRMSPLIKKDTADMQYFKKLGCVNAPMHNMDAELCWVLSLTPSEEEILKGMRKSHRYLIRRGDQYDVSITKTIDPHDVDAFLEIYNNLALKKHFVPHRGIKEEVDIMGKDDEALLFLARYQGKIVGGAIIVFVGNMAIYHHGATLDGYRDVPISYLIQWEAIKEAKKRGKTLYNFWGIAPKEAKNHPWQGHSLFKMGFGGEEKEFIHAQDIPLSLMYWRTYCIEFIRKKMKGY